MHLPPRTLLLTLSMTMCALIAAAGCSGGQGSTDAGTDTGPACGSGRFESFDWQCKSHIGCQPLNAPGCGCRCVMCNDEECVEQVCEPACGLDGGHDASEEPDDGSIAPDSGSRDAGHDVAGEDVYQFPCDYHVDRDGSYIEGDWDGGVKIYLGDYGFASVNDKYLFLANYAGYRIESDIILTVSLDNKMITGYIRSCKNENDTMNNIQLSDTSLFWTRSGYYSSDVFYLDLTSVDDPIRITSSGRDLFTGFKQSIVSCNAYFTSVEPGTIYYDNHLSGESITANIGIDVAYGLLWDKTYYFQASYVSPEVKSCLRSYNFDSGDLVEYFCTNRLLLTSGYSWKGVYQDWRDAHNYGHPSTDIFVYDFLARKETRVTNDEASQWCPRMFNNLVVYKDLSDLGAAVQGPEGAGSLWVYDIDNGLKRKLPIEPMDGCPMGVGDRYIAYIDGYDSGPIYLIDMVNAGVVKDGHVVPE